MKIGWLPKSVYLDNTQDMKPNEAYVCFKFPD